MEELNGGGRIYMRCIVWTKNPCNLHYSGLGQHKVPVGNITYINIQTCAGMRCIILDILDRWINSENRMWNGQLSGPSRWCFLLIAASCSAFSLMSTSPFWCNMILASHLENCFSNLLLYKISAWRISYIYIHGSKSLTTHIYQTKSNLYIYNYTETYWDTNNTYTNIYLYIYIIL